MISLRRLLCIGSFVGDCILQKKIVRIRHAFDNDARNVLISLNRCEPEKFQSVLDGGANHGKFSRSILRICPKVKVISVEPLAALPTSNFPRCVLEIQTDLQKLSSEFPDLVVIGKALSNEKSKKKFFITQSDQCSSLVQPPEKSVSGAFNTLETYQVDTTTIDDIIESEKIRKLDLLKLDLQGGEFIALQGAMNTLKITRFVLIEINLRRIYPQAPSANAVIELLHDRGFLFEKIVNFIRTADGSLAQCDGLFRKVTQLYC